MTSPSIWLNHRQMARMCEYVVPRTSVIGASVMLDDAGAHNSIVEAFFRASGRTPLRIYGGATGVKQVGDDGNFNGRKKNFCKMSYEST